MANLIYRDKLLEAFKNADQLWLKNGAMVLRVLTFSDIIRLITNSPSVSDNSASEIATLKQDRNDLNYLCMERLHKIEELESKLKIAVDALKYYSDCNHYTNEPTGKIVLVDYGCKADAALKQIEVK